MLCTFGHPLDMSNRLLDKGGNPDNGAEMEIADTEQLNDSETEEVRQLLEEKEEEEEVEGVEEVEEVEEIEEEEMQDDEEEEPLESDEAPDHSAYDEEIQINGPDTIGEDLADGPVRVSPDPCPRVLM